MLSESLSLVLAAVHFGTPLAYYAYMRRYLVKPWDIRTDENYRPKITVILPTYNERNFVEDKLRDMFAQDYPKNLVGVIVVDDGSDDGTPELVEKWVGQHTDLEVKLIRKDLREGKLFALKKALEHIPPPSEIVILTDADAYWQPDAISKVSNYFADPAIGSVTGSIVYAGGDIGIGETAYRDYYNALRVAESKKHSTPIQNGPLLAIRTQILSKRGLPTFLGSDDSAFGSFIAFMGYRAIQAGNIVVREPARGNQFRRKVRRANRLLLNFRNTKYFAKKSGVYVHSPFDEIWRVEYWLHIVNPWLLLASGALLVSSILLYASQIAAMMLGLGLVPAVFGTYRMWILQQVYLLVARVRSIWTKDVMWKR